MKTFHVYIGYDEREAAAYRVCVQSLVRRSPSCVIPHPLIKSDLSDAGIYRRKEEPGYDPGVRIDSFDHRPFSTDFTFTRFLVPELHREGWALFCDSDILFLDGVDEVFDLADPKYAVMCVKHNHEPTEKQKMDGQPQTNYPRKNWSSFVLWNCSHPAHDILKAGAANVWSGRDLHAFKWLKDEEIGELPEAWNWLEGWSGPEICPKAVHYTRGGPWFPQWQGVHHADLWNWENSLQDLQHRDFDFVKKMQQPKLVSSR